MGNPFVEKLKEQVPDFIKKNPRTSSFIGIFSIVFIAFLMLPQLQDSLNVVKDLFSSNEMTEKELIEQWLKENFTDSTYNVLIFPFNDYREDATKKLKVEKSINDRIDEYRRNELYKIRTKSKIKIKFYEEVESNISIDTLRSIANKYKSNLMIYGNIYDEPKTATINYYIFSKSNAQKVFGTKGSIKGIAFKSMYDFREGKILRDLDYLTYWIFCNELLFNKDFNAVSDTWNSIKRNFKENIFFGSNAYLTARIGVTLHLAQRLNEAKEFYILSLSYLQTPSASNNLGLIYRSKKNLDSSRIYFEKALKINPNYYMAYNNLGTLYMEEYHLYDEAMNYFKKVIQFDSTDTDALFNIGLLYGRYLSDPETAKKYFLSALKYLTNTPEKEFAIFKSMGDSYSDFNFNTAKYYYNKAIRINPKDARIYYNLGVLFNDYERFDSAKYYYLKAIQINPHFDSVYFNLGVLYKNKLLEPNAALFYFKKALKINPNEGKYYDNIGLLYEHDFQNIDSAVICYKRAIEVDPLYENAYFSLSYLYLEKIKNIDSALTYCEKTIKINPLNAGAHNNLATLLYHDFSKYKLAAKHFETAIKINPSLGEAYINYANLLAYKLNNKIKAKEYYNRAINIDKKFQDKELEVYLNKK